MRNVLGKDRKKIIIFDRAYASLKLIFNMIDHNEKFLFRLNSTHFKKEQISMKSNDEWIDIIFDRARLNQFRTDFYFVERLLNLKKLNLRFVKVPIETPDGEVIDEYLLTNLENDVFDLDSLKHLYHMRWNIETSYRMLKSNLKLEDFTGKKPTVVYQDIYISTFVFNITQVIIIEANEKYKFKQENHKYEKKVNNNYAFGTVKTNFIKVLFEKGIKKSNQMMEDLLKSISNTRVPIRDNRSFSRDRTPVNKCRMSYKYSY